MKKLKGFLLGLLMCAIAFLIDRRLNATERAAFSKGKAGTSAGPTHLRNKPFSHWEAIMPKQARFELPYWIWLVIFLFGLYFILAVGKAEAQSVHFQVADSLPSSGRVVCDSSGNIVVLIRGGLSNNALAEAINHELVHVSQIYQSKLGCKGFDRRFREDWRFRFENEVMAYMLTQDWPASNREDDLAVMDRFAGFIYYVYDGVRHVSYAEAKPFIVQLVLQYRRPP